MKQVFCSFA